MEVIIIKELSEEFFSFETHHNTFKDIMNYMKYLKGKEYVDEIINSEYSFILIKGEFEEVIGLTPEIVHTPMNSYDSLIILKKVTGELPLIPIIIAVAAALAASAAFDAIVAVGVSIYVAYAAYALITIAGMVASFYVSQAISPHPAVAGDPIKGSEAMSNLFTTATITVAQGGCIPLLYGQTFCGGTLICFSVTTVQG